MKPMRIVGGGAALLVAALSLAIAASSSGQPQRPAFAGIFDEHPAIRYAEAPVTDALTQLARMVASGEQRLTLDGPAGYLGSVLRALDVPPESQLLVFSKTGIQRASTNPTNPRALYFNDSIIVGYIPGARYLEIAAQDPRQGINFYTVDQLATAAPVIERRTNCLTCHVSASTLDVPGVIVRSNFTNANGELLPQLGFHLVDHRTPLPQRWGGWFVTGKYDLAPYGGVTHLGNVATAMHPSREEAAGTSNEILLGWLDADISRLGYPSHESDIAALMVFDHQTRAMNLLTRLNWEARIAEYEGRVDYTRGDLAAFVNEVADYLLFVDEVPPPARLTPRPGFAAHFTARGPKDSRGRSLRDLDLTTRLLTHRCSYMIYAPAFTALPDAARQAVYQRMRAVLAGADRAGDREAVSAILRETVSDWPRN